MYRNEVSLPRFKQKIFSQALQEVTQTIGKVQKIKRLKGLTNINFLIKTDNINLKYIVLKVLQLNSVTQNTNEGEFNNKLNELKICPKILINKFPSYYVVEYILGKRPRKSDFNNEYNRNNLLHNISTIHKQSFNNVTINFINTNKSLLQSLKICKEVLNLQIKLDVINLALKTVPATLGFCHNDLNMNNFIIDKNNKLWCIDFEYSGFGDIFFDITSLGHTLRKDSYFQFLESYYKQNLQFLDYKIFQKKLDLFKIVLLTTSVVWYLYMSKIHKNNYNGFKKQVYKLNSEFHKIYTFLY